jgi:thiamine biosynthesis protein ThiI
MAGAPRLDALVVHHHEIGLKGRNRDYFEAALVRNLKKALHHTGFTRVKAEAGRVTIQFTPQGDPLLAARRASRLFGVAYVGVGRIVEPEMEAISEAGLELMAAAPFGSFCVRARRTHSKFEQRSQEIHEVIGQRIKDATGARVDLKNAEATLWVELYGKTGIVYRERLEGIGGLPSGVSGRMVVLLSGGIDSPVAAWRAARRGAQIELLHFHGQPFTDPSSVRQATELAQVLADYNVESILHLVPLGDVQREIVTQAPSELRVILYRRMMFRIAAELARRVGGKALVTGDSLGQVASQTIENIVAVDAAIPGVAILRPLVGMTKQEIMDDAKRIGTYEISTRKHQDCCVLFEPRSPSIRTRVVDAERAESGLDIEELVGKALAGIETRRLSLLPSSD